MTISKMQGHIYELFIIRGELFTNNVTYRANNMRTIPESLPNREKKKHGLTKVDGNNMSQIDYLWDVDSIMETWEDEIKKLPLWDVDDITEQWNEYIEERR